MSVSANGPQYNYQDNKAPPVPINTRESETQVKSSVEHQKMTDSAEKTTEIAKNAKVVPTENEINLAIKFLKEGKEMLKYPSLKIVPEVTSLLKNIISEPVKVGTNQLEIQQAASKEKESLSGEMIKELAEYASQLEDLNSLIFNQPLERVYISQMFQKFSERKKVDSSGCYVLGKGYDRSWQPLDARIGKSKHNPSVRRALPSMLTLSYQDKRDGKMYQEYLKIDNTTGEVQSIKTYPFQTGWQNTGKQFIWHYLLSHPGITISKIIKPS